MVYRNGKSAVRLTKSVEPDGAHRFMGKAVVSQNSGMEVRGGDGGSSTMHEVPIDPLLLWTIKYGTRWLQNAQIGRQSRVKIQKPRDG